MIPEVPPSIDTRRHCRDAKCSKRRGICAATARTRTVSADRCEKSRDVFRYRQPTLSRSDPDSQWLEHSIVGFQCHDMLVDLGAMRVPVSVCTASSVLLVGPRDYPNCAL